MDTGAENQNSIGIFTTDARLSVQVWDASLERMTGIPAERARGKTVGELIPDLESRRLLARFERVLEEGSVEVLAPAFHRFLIACPPQFASRRFAEMRQRVTLAPLREGQEIRGVMVTIEDVTRRMEREMELADELKNGDEAARLRAAKAVSGGDENLGEETAAPIIDALGDKSWRVRRELVETLSRRAAPDAIAALLRAMQQRHFDFGVLNSALQVLQATSVKTTETLVEFLRGEDADLRMQAALTLGEQKDPRAVPALVDALRDENANVRYHAVEALGKLKAVEAREPLLRIAETRDFFLSFAALDALRRIGGEAVAGRVRPLLGDPFLREAAAETLAAVGTAEDVPALAGLLNEDGSSAPAVAAALSALFDRREEESAGGGAAVVERARAAVTAEGMSNLLAALEDPAGAELIPVVRVAGWFDDERVRARLAALLENENLRDEAARALAAQGGGSGHVVDLLTGKLEAEDPDVRLAAARALGATGDGRAFGPLAELLETGGDDASRRAAVGALKMLAHPGTVSRLGGLLAAEDARVREAALRVVGHFGAAGCEDAVFDCCEDADEGVRRAAVEQLPNVRDGRAVETLIRVLKRDAATRAREAAAKALAAVGGDKPVAALREALGDPDAWTRYFAVRALGSLRDVASSEVLAAMAENDSAEQVRVAAREVLGGLKV